MNEKSGPRGIGRPGNLKKPPATGTVWPLGGETAAVGKRK